MSAADTIDEIIGAELSPRGFARISPRRWVGISRPPIRSIFEFQALKGNSYSARWGFSLDFVPLWRADSFRWKRTAKTADFDLCIDPIDQRGGPRPIPLHDVADFTRITLAVRQATGAAKLDFDRAHSISDVVAMFQDRAAMRFRRFSLENYTQTHLAWGLSLIALGEILDGERHLALFCARFSAERNDRMMRQAVSAAASECRPR